MGQKTDRERRKITRKFFKGSRPTLEKVLKADTNFFTRLKAADAEFCKRKIQKAKPEFILGSVKVDYSSLTGN